jgi:hypothetical protein
MNLDRHLPASTWFYPAEQCASDDDGGSHDQRPVHQRSLRVAKCKNQTLERYGSCGIHDLRAAHRG